LRDSGGELGWGFAEVSFEPHLAFRLEKTLSITRRGEPGTRRRANEHAVAACDIARHLGHQDSGELARLHQDARLARERVREAFRQAPPATSAPAIRPASS
jgi:hypothetical protein